MKISLINFTAIFILCLSACGKKSTSTTPVPSIPQDKLTETKWCSVSTPTDNFHMVTRYSLMRGAWTNKAQVELLRTRDSDVAVYKLHDNYDWELKTAENNPTSVRNIIELVENEDKVISLNGHQQQAFIFNQILKANPNLKPAFTDEFSPKTAIIVKNRSSLKSEDNGEQILYPCASYSATFTEDAPIRPMIEFSLEFGQFIWNNHYDLERDGLAKSMSLTFPVDQRRINEINLAGTHWCAWHQMDSGRILMNIISFGKDKYIKSSETSIIFEDEFLSHSREGTLQAIANEAKVFKITEYDTYLRGERNFNFNIGKGEDSFTINEKFTFVQDATGKPLLISIYPHSDLVSLATSFYQIYFDCADPRPLELNEGIKGKLPKFLQFHKAKIEN